MPFSWLDIEFVIKEKTDLGSRAILTQFPLTSIIPQDTDIDHFRQVPYQAFEDHIKLQLLKLGKIVGRSKFRWNDSLRENVVEFDDRHGFHLMLKRFEAEGTHLRTRRINVEVKTLAIYDEAGERADDVLMPEA